MDMDGPDASAQLLICSEMDIRIAAIDAQAETMKADLLRNLLRESARNFPLPSLPPASELRAPAPPAPAPASVSAPARPSRSIRGSRRAVIVDAVPRRGRAARASVISIGSTRESEATDEAPNIPDAIQSIIDGAGLMPYTLSWGENERANMTPKVSRSGLADIFGGPDFSKLEWPRCDLGPPYQFFFCGDSNSQPFAPTSIGDRGLVICPPPWTGGRDDEPEGRTFHVFMSVPKENQYKYLGDYEKVTLTQPQIEWALLPNTCREAWLKRMYHSRTAAGRAIRVRIELRQILKREPSVAEVQGRMNKGRVKWVKWKELLEAFRSGKEKMRIIGLKCERYDSNLALHISSDRAT